MHVVLRSSLATGSWSLRRRQNRERVERELGRFARRFGIRIYQAANSGNHLHLLLRARRRLDFQNFLRALTGAIARFVTCAQPGHRADRFWDLLAYSRVVQWGRDYFGVRAYVLQNEWEALGLVRRRPRKVPEFGPRGPTLAIARS
jgi:REP element-mobilizing transposase RayT